MVKTLSLRIYLQAIHSNNITEFFLLIIQYSDKTKYAMPDTEYELSGTKKKHLHSNLKKAQNESIII